MAKKEIVDWITVNGHHVPILEGEDKATAIKKFYDDGERLKREHEERLKREETKKQEQIAKNEQQANDKNKSFDYNNIAIKQVSDEEKTKLKKNFAHLRAERRDFMQEHQEELEGGHLYVDSPLVKEFINLNEKVIDAEFRAHQVMPPVILDSSKWNSTISVLTKDEAVIARKDLLSDKELYTAIQFATIGTSAGTMTADTEVDSLYKNDKSVYNIFANTRKMLKEKYGEYITLYRAGTNATKKATINMASTKKNAQQYADWYGSKVSSKKIKIDDILAINIDRTGDYEEFIILNKGGKI